MVDDELEDEDPREDEGKILERRFSLRAQRWVPAVSPWLLRETFPAFAWNTP